MKIGKNELANIQKHHRNIINIVAVRLMQWLGFGASNYTTMIIIIKLLSKKTTKTKNKQGKPLFLTAREQF